MDHDYEVSGRVIGCAIDVHKVLGPGLKEKPYEAALCQALSKKGIQFTRGRTVTLHFEGARIGDHRPDLIVENTVVVEVKSVEKMHPLFMGSRGSSVERQRPHWSPEPPCPPSVFSLRVLRLLRVLG